MPKKFTVIDEAFTCAVCKAEVPVLGYTSRDHCNACLCSLHVDNNPGDRGNECKGVLRPVGLELNKKGRQILYKCDLCGISKKNITADDDNEDLIVKLSAKNIYEI